MKDIDKINKVIEYMKKTNPKMNLDKFVWDKDDNKLFVYFISNEPKTIEKRYLDINCFSNKEAEEFTDGYPELFV